MASKPILFQWTPTSGARKSALNLVNMAAASGDKALLAKIRETEATLSNLREQKAA